MKTNWTEPGCGSTIGELKELFGECPKRCQKNHHNFPYDSRTNLFITPTGEVEEYDFQRLHSDALEIVSA